ncbi:T9SS type A sorting domain-containing protein, partial [Flavobacteriaceae bacterium LMO-SS05]
CYGDGSATYNLNGKVTGGDAGGSWSDTDASGVTLGNGSSVNFSALGAGVYHYKYTVNPAEGSTCDPDDTTVTITIDDPVDAGTGGSDRWCYGDGSATYNLNGKVTGGDAGGSWSDTDASGVTLGNGSSVNFSALGAGVYHYKYTVTPADANSTCPPDDTTVTITIDDPVDAGTGGSDRWCYGDGSATYNLNGKVTGGDAGGSWSDTDASGVTLGNGSSVNFSALGAGVYHYKYTVNPAEGSTCDPDDTTVTITIDDPVDAGTGGSDRWCYGDGSATYNLNGKVTGGDAGGSWSDTDASGVTLGNGSSVNFSALGTGVYHYKYTVTPADANSTCPPDDTTVTITIDDPVDAGTGGSDRWCYGDGSATYNLNGKVTGGDAGGSWSDTDASGVTLGNGSSVNFSALGAGVYHYKYTVNPAEGSTCDPDDTTVTITIDDPVDAGTGGSDRWCYGDGSATYNLNGKVTGGDAGGSWSDTDASGVTLGDGSSVDFSGLGVGVYHYKYTVTPADANSTCPPDNTTVTITIDENPSCDASNSGQECDGFGIAIQLFATTDAVNASYSWTGPNSFASSEQNPLVYEGGTYYVTITNTDTGCTSTCNTTAVYYQCVNPETAFGVWQGKLPEGVTENPNNDVESTCFRTNGFSRWGWTNLIPGENVEGVPYILDLYQGAGKCDLSKGTLAGHVEIDYRSGTVNVKYIMNDGFGMYEAHLYIGCNAYPKTKKGDDTVAPGQYNFNAGGLVNAKEWNASIDGVSGEVFIIAHAVVSGENLCEGCYIPPSPFTGGEFGDADNPTATDCKGPTGDFRKADFTAYPVPFTDEVNLKYSFDYDTKVTIEVFDVKGTLVKSFVNGQYVKGSVERTTIDLSKTDNQMYFVRLTTDQGTVVKKIVSDGLNKQ